MKLIFWPAVQVMLRLPNERKLPLMLAIFYLPCALLYYATAEQLTPVLKIWVAAGANFQSAIIIG